MRENNKRIGVELSLHALGSEINQLAGAIEQLDEGDRIYLRDLNSCLGHICTQLDQRSCGHFVSLGDSV